MRRSPPPLAMQVEIERMDASAFVIGTMGYSYTDWRNGVFYPKGMPPRDFLAHYSQRFNGVEMDNTFYGIPRASSVQQWTSLTPDGFIFCPKTPRAITHELRLNATAVAQMAEFLEVVRLFGPKLGPILVQFPPDFTLNEWESLAQFLANLPADLSFTMEFRHRSWYKRRTSELLQAHGVAWTSTDYIYLPAQVHATADFIYLRLLGRHGSYAQKVAEQVDSMPRLQWWWQEMQPHLPHMRAVYIFANNDYAGYSPTTCEKFKRIIEN